MRFIVFCAIAKEIFGSAVPMQESVSGMAGSLQHSIQATDYPTILFSGWKKTAKEIFGSEVLVVV
jgi:hypothetical protein